MLRIVSLEHFRADGPGRILDWIEKRGHALRRVFLDEGHPLPAVADFDFLIVMGGPMNIYEHEAHPWLVPEKALMRETVDAGKPILGVCLGGQLLADVLGGKVTRNREREVGWWPVTFRQRPGPFGVFPERTTVFHWHGDTFSLPPGAVHVADNAACDHQAFLAGDRWVGLQFHIEVSHVEGADLAKACPDDLRPGTYVQSADGILHPPPQVQQLQPMLEGMLDYLAGLAKPAP